MPASAPPDPTWGMCQFCGVAVAPGAKVCGICGAADPVPAALVARASKPIRRRIQMSGFLRSVIVIGVVFALAYSTVSVVLSGPPVVSDPLTTSGSYEIGPGNFTVIMGEITGGDYVIGNYTTVDPVGTNLDVAVYNSTLWTQFELGHDPAPLWTNSPGPSGRIIYSAPYTDSFFFVFTNPYPPTSDLRVTAFIVTQYESNVGDDGFAA
ncbi:MAG: hypothetical protein WB809_06690 [Thermoplasmata archaeon]